MQSKKSINTKRRIQRINKKIAHLLKKIEPRCQFKTAEEQAKITYLLLRQYYELQNVSLEVYSGLLETEKTTLIEYHWESELDRALFQPGIFLYST